ncbi:hypothetical protein MMC18_007690 [Xylographa bjoerkii]|nr:hypothetical protein [Xylographa bjoerkii]
MDRSPSSGASLKKQYLTAYNAISALLWLFLLGRVLLLLPSVGYQNIYAGVGQYAKWTQTLAALEIAHSAFSASAPPTPLTPSTFALPQPIPLTPSPEIVRSPLLTTSIQVFSRLLLVWGIVNIWPDTTGQSLFYSSMLVAWSVTEVIRYSYFVLNLQGEVPGFLTWLRYNTFYVLYPLGIGSEMACVYMASTAAKTRGTKLLLWDLLVLYLPASYLLYTHMMAQRRKVIRGKQPERRLAN